MVLRLSYWFYRFLLSNRVLGFINSVKMFVLFYLSKSILKINYKNKHFFFRGKNDVIICHFYNKGYYIKENGRGIKTIIDGGANIGAETFRFRIHYPAAKVISIEPSSENFEILEQNFKQDENVYLLNQALWKSSGELYLNDGGGSLSFYVSDDDKKGKVAEKVTAISLNEIVQKWGIDEIDILKLDVEGAEKEIFSDNLEWLPHVNCLIFEVPDSKAPFSTQEIYNQLAAKGLKYKSYICDECLVLIKEGLPWEYVPVNGFYSAS